MPSWTPDQGYKDLGKGEPMSSLVPRTKTLVVKTHKGDKVVETPIKFDAEGRQILKFKPKRF